MNKKMTEKIKELSDAAEWYTEADPLKKNPIFDRQKFAELIVKEAGALLMSPEFIGRSDLDWSMVLNEHFGVEE